MKKYQSGEGEYRMASFLNRLFGRKKEESLSFRRERAAELHGLAIRYVTERIDGEDLVAGRGGCLSVRNGELILLSSEKILFRANVDLLDASRLMSGDGVVLTAPNLEEDGKMRTYTAHFVYHRK